MAEIADLNISDASNTARFPEGQAPSTVNDGARALEGLLARGFKDAVEGDQDSTGSANAYAVSASRTLSAYYDGLRIGFHASFANTGAATLNVDSVGAKSIKKFHDQDLASGDIEQHQYVDVIYSASDDAWQLQSHIATAPALTDAAQTFTKTQTWTKGSDVASASTLTLGDGNWFDVTGTTAITAIATKAVGTLVVLQFDGILTFTHHATDLILPGAANITTAAGDIAVLYEYATGDWRCIAYTRASGAPVSGGATQAQMEAETATTAYVTPDVAKHAPSAVKFWCFFDGTATGPISPTADYNVVDITDNGTGDYTVNIDNSFSGTSWSPYAMAGDDKAVHIQGAPTAGTLRLSTRDGSDNTTQDINTVSVGGFGDQ